MKQPSSTPSALGDPTERLRPYQLQGVHFLTTRSSALLADEMGLGKTVQTAVAIHVGGMKYQRVLIVSPASLCLNWLREIQQWIPSVVARRVTGTMADRLATYRLPIQVLVASYEQIRVDAPYIQGTVTFDLVILDEAQRIKNVNSASNWACRVINRTNSWALSGTPLENSPDDLFGIFRFLSPGALNKGMSIPETHTALQPYFLRRTKSQVLPDLPPMLLREIRLELNGPQRETYQLLWESRAINARGRDGKISAVSMLALLTRLKQVCNFDRPSAQSAKLEALTVVLDNLTSNNEKVIIFSQYVETLQWLSTRIQMPNSVFHGGLTLEERDRALKTFAATEGSTALLISLKAGGVGLNLQEASTVVLFDRWWNPASEAQAIQRAHRFGRSNPLQIVRFLVEDSIEEDIATILSMKEELFDQYINEAPLLESVLSEKELRAILRIGEDSLDRMPAPSSNPPTFHYA